MSRDRQLYAVYENDKVVLQGDHNEVAELCQIKSRAISNYVRWNILVNGKYIIKNLGSNYRSVRKPKTKSKEQIFSYLYRHLAEYGNTCLNDDPKEYLPRLEELLNEKICVRTCYDMDDPYNFELNQEQGVTEYRRGRKNKYYILEVM